MGAMKLTAKEYLSRGFLLDKKIKTKLEQIQYLRTLQTSVSATLSHANAKTSGKRNRIGDITVEIVDLAEEYLTDIKNLYSKTP